MLQAIINKKAGRSISSNEVHWSELFSASEDSLTSTIFGLLNYLPNSIFWDVLLNFCFENPIKFNSIIESIEYWPHWDAENTNNSNFVEPDIFIRTSLFDLIVEAKKSDYNQQSHYQWKNEFQSYLNHYSIDNKPVFLLAVGGISIEKNETITIEDKEIIIVKCRWSKILKRVKLLIDKIKREDPLINHSLLSILNDIILGFRIHGFYTGDSFESTMFKDKINQSSIDFLRFKLVPFKTFSISSLNREININNSSLYFFNSQSNLYDK